MAKGEVSGYRWNEKEKEEKETCYPNKRIYRVPDAKDRWKKCRTCKYASKEGMRAYDGKHYYQIYSCLYILYKCEMRNSDPKECDKYEKKITANGMTIVHAPNGKLKEVKLNNV